MNYFQVLLKMLSMNNVLLTMFNFMSEEQNLLLVEKEDSLSCWLWLTSHINISAVLCSRDF
ncbi:hypothetical protein Patl1_24352 [Pistacia atlantica]|uniref:Uncharacterized protein n=1 Tax=Pistacia atlantica TaxID=434234 RepID=A0ACC0ZZ14_9ROSI|nr:hypothetical protein Patl1_24352 [Pistacia atlantica]